MYNVINISLQTITGHLLKILELCLARKMSMIVLKSFQFKTRYIYNYNKTIKYINYMKLFLKFRKCTYQLECRIHILTILKNRVISPSLKS